MIIFIAMSLSNSFKIRIDNNGQNIFSNKITHQYLLFSMLRENDNTLIINTFVIKLKSNPNALIELAW